MAAVDLTAARLRELPRYEPQTGAFTWLKSRQGNRSAGDAAGSMRSDGYVRIGVEQRRFWAHRLAWLYMHGVWPSGQIDHINGDPSDNRLENLRDVPARINMQNERRARRRKNGGTLLGAHWSTTWKRWKSSINDQGRLKHLGWFGSEQEAHAAYLKAKRQLHEGCTI